MIDETQLTELIALAAQATPGPWVSWNSCVIVDDQDQKHVAYAAKNAAMDNNADFIVAACNLAPALAAEVVELRKRLQEANEDAARLYWQIMHGDIMYGGQAIAAHRARVEAKHE
jgi:hypothetical protein